MYALFLKKKLTPPESDTVPVLVCESKEMIEEYLEQNTSGVVIPIGNNSADSERVFKTGPLEDYIYPERNGVFNNKSVGIVKILTIENILEAKQKDLDNMEKIYNQRIKQYQSMFKDCKILKPVIN